MTEARASVIFFAFKIFPAFGTAHILAVNVIAGLVCHTVSHAVPEKRIRALVRIGHTLITAIKIVCHAVPHRDIIADLASVFGHDTATEKTQETVAQ